MKKFLIMAMAVVAITAALTLPQVSAQADDNELVVDANVVDLNLTFDELEYGRATSVSMYRFGLVDRPENLSDGLRLEPVWVGTIHPDSDVPASTICANSMWTYTITEDTWHNVQSVACTMLRDDYAIDRTGTLYYVLRDAEYLDADGNSYTVDVVQWRLTLTVKNKLSTMGIEYSVPSDVDDPKDYPEAAGWAHAVAYEHDGTIDSEVPNGAVGVRLTAKPIHSDGVKITFAPYALWTPRGPSPQELTAQNSISFTPDNWKTPQRLEFQMAQDVYECRDQTDGITSNPEIDGLVPSLNGTPAYANTMLVYLLDREHCGLEISSTHIENLLASIRIKLPHAIDAETDISYSVEDAEKSASKCYIAGDDSPFTAYADDGSSWRQHRRVYVERPTVYHKGCIVTITASNGYSLTINPWSD